MSTTHPNSKKVWIRRTDTFLDAVQTQAKEFMSLSRKSIGSFWENSMSRVVGTGLSFNEQRLLLPNIVDYEPEDRDFRKAVTKFYKDIRTSIPAGDGLELEIGLEVSNDKPIGWKAEDGSINMPIKISDYIRYRHAVAHPWCAPSFKESQGNQSIYFFVYDPEVEDMVVAEDTAQRDKAMEIYLTLKEKPEKVRDMLLLLGVDITEYSGPNAKATMASRLRILAETRAVDFNKVYTIDNFEIRSRIEGFVRTGIFRKVGERIISADDNKPLGNNIKEVVDLLMGDNPEYKEKMTLWMGAYQDALAKPAMAKRGSKKAATA